MMALELYKKAIRCLITVLFLLLSLPLSCSALVPVVPKNGAFPDLFISIVNYLVIIVFAPIIYYLVLSAIKRVNLMKSEKFLKHILFSLAGWTLIYIIIIRFLYKVLYYLITYTIGQMPAYLYDYDSIINKLNIISRADLFQGEMMEIALMGFYFFGTFLLLAFFNYWLAKKLFNLTKQQSTIVGFLMGILANPFIFYPFISNIYYLLMMGLK